MKVSRIPERRSSTPRPEGSRVAGSGAGTAGRGPLLFLVACAIAVVSAICGVGGGIFGVPVLHYFFGVALQTAVATTLCLVVASASAATVSELVHPDGALFASVVASLVVGSLLGAQLGFWTSRRISTGLLKTLFCLLLGAVGLRLMFMNGLANAAPVAGFAPGPRELAPIAALGFAAGIAVPLLGVGGGLIVVPGLLLALPEVGYLGARAASLAMAVVTASRSVWLYASRRMIDWSTGLWFGAGGLVGAAGGVWIVHQHGAAEVGQVLLGTTLTLAATRFGIDAVRARKAARRPQA